MMTEVMDNMDMLRTPLKARNQDFTPALGKRHASSTMFENPCKRPLTANPSLGGNMTFATPVKSFKKPTNMILPCKTPGRLTSIQTPGKFSIYQDADVKRETKKTIPSKFNEPVERCPWAENHQGLLSRRAPPPPLRIIEDHMCKEPPRKQLKLLHLDPLPISVYQDELLFNFDGETTLPDLPANLEPEEPELCPWQYFPDTSVIDESGEDLDLDSSAFSELDRSRQKLADISIRCFEESYNELTKALNYDATLHDDLPDLPSTPDLDQQLSELLLLSFNDL